MMNVTLYTDGACSGNPGKGGWAAILQCGEYVAEYSGAEYDTTNNRMELMAVIQGLSRLNMRCTVDVYSDSAYVVNAVQNKWLFDWQQNNWRTSAGKETKNVDLWTLLLSLMDKHDITFYKVAGHADNELNNRCDKLAVAAYTALK